MSQNERYEAGVKKKFHLQMIAQRLGWSEGSRELRYAFRCSLHGQPQQRGIHLGSPRAPAPGTSFPSNGSSSWESRTRGAPSLLHLLR